MAIRIAGVDVINDDRELVLAKLTDINETINDTAVDVFIYDTSKDSDGGAWRHRTQHTSWYAEASSASRDVNTRSTRAEFPAVAVIVAEANKVTIYDGDDPSLPMWMVFETDSSPSYDMATATTNITSVFFLNGVLCIGTAQGNWGAAVINFPADDGKMWFAGTQQQYNGGIVTRNDGLGYYQLQAFGIVNAMINDVAMTVLPDAPTDPATGLPVPTIAVATDGGVSVIKDDGTVVDSAGTLTMGTVNFDDDNGLWYSRNVASHLLWYSTSSDYQAGDGFGDVVADDYNNNYSFPLLTRTNRVAVASEIYIGGSSGDTGFVKNGLMLHQPNYTNQAEGMSALTTSSYNTGWMPGDIKLAALADTDTTALSGAALNNTTNYTTEWTALQSDWTINTNQLVCDGASGAVALAAINFATAGIDKADGDQLGIRFTVSSYTSGQLDVSFSNGAATETAITGTGTYEFTNTLSANDVLYLRSNSGAGAFVGIVDNVEIFDVDPDRSVNGKGLGVHGSITKTAVATGADVVGYSGFDASNYLEQPYNADLDFGTGDFCVMGWFKSSDTTHNEVFFERSLGGANPYLRIRKYVTTSYIGVYTNDSGVTSTTAYSGDWVFVVAKRLSGVLYLYLNGTLVGSVANATNLTSSGATVNFGSAANLLYCSLALFRISATAPTADQIKKIYEDEKVLFQEDAKATLTGSSDAVTALAHDPDTDLLHVGTSGGRSVFQGLRRVEEHTGTDSQSLAAISAVDGLVVEGK